jgi:hypothetical protein
MTFIQRAINALRDPMRGIEYVRAMKGGWLQARNTGRTVTARVLANCLNLQSPAPLLDPKHISTFGRKLPPNIDEAFGWVTATTKDPERWDTLERQREFGEIMLRRWLSTWNFHLPRRMFRRKDSLRQDQ